MQLFRSSKAIQTVHQRYPWANNFIRRPAAEDILRKGWNAQHTTQIAGVQLTALHPSHPFQLLTFGNLLILLKQSQGLHKNQGYDS